VPAFAISAATHDGVQELMNLTASRLRELRQEDAERAASAVLSPVGPVLRPEPDEAFAVERTEAGFLVRGKRVERMAAMTNTENVEAMERLERNLRKMGVLDALEEAGVQPGDTVRLGKVELEWGAEL
jgi:GTP-binding protein